MDRITAYLSPNGCNRSHGAGPATRLTVATLKGVAQLERAEQGAPWTLAGRSLADRHVGSLVYEPASGKLFAGCHRDGGVWVSDDGVGASWRTISNGIDRPHIYSLAARRIGNRVTLLAGASPAALYRSDDLGESWREITSLRDVPDTDKWTFPPPPHIPHVKCIEFDPRDNRTIYALVEQGALLKSTDDGESWTELAAYSEPDEIAYRDVHRLLLDPGNPERLFLATGEGLYRSADGGRSFDHLMRRGERIGYPDFLFFDPDDSATVYMGGSFRNPGVWYQEKEARSGVLRTDDSGDSWRELSNGLPNPVIGAFEAMSLHSWDGGVMLAVGTATGQVYASEDRGESWQLIAADVTPVSKDDHHLPFLSEEARREAMALRNL